MAEYIQLFFDRNAKLASEFQRLFGSLLVNPDDYMSIVRLLSKRHTGYTRDEIAAKLGMASGGTFTKMLGVLGASDFIIGYHPFGFSQKEIRYKLTDSFCQFYLCFVDGQRLSYCFI